MNNNPWPPKKPPRVPLELLREIAEAMGAGEMNYLFGTDLADEIREALNGNFIEK